MSLLSRSSLISLPVSLALALAGMAPQLVHAQEAAVQNRVVPMENVRIDYAKVMGVQPVYQTLRATRTEERCEAVAEPVATAKPEDEGRLSRMLDSVKDVFSRRQETRQQAPVTPAPARRNCRLVEVGREFRRPVAYDVDYVYKGTKYRSRLPEDPGNRLRIRVSVTPDMPVASVGER